MPSFPAVRAGSPPTPCFSPRRPGVRRRLVGLLLLAVDPCYQATHHLSLLLGRLMSPPNLPTRTCTPFLALAATVLLLVAGPDLRHLVGPNL